MKTMAIFEDMLEEIRQLRAITESLDDTMGSVQNDVRRIKEALGLQEDFLRQTTSTEPNSTVHYKVPNDSKEAELFFRIARLYRKERERKERTGAERMSTHLLSQQTASEITALLREKMARVNGLTIEPDNPYVIVRAAERLPTLIRYFNDLGFYRGEQWYKEIRTKVGEKAQELGIRPEQVRLLVGTMRNSLDADHVRKVLGPNAPTGNELHKPENRGLLERYVSALRQGVPKEVVTSSSKVHFISFDRHPNETDLWDSYGNPVPHRDWFFPHIEQMISELLNEYHH